MGDIHQNDALLEDVGNLAAYLYLLRERHPGHYQTIVETIRLAAPFFGDFVLRPHPLNPEKIRLEWRERGSDLIFGPDALSDGTLRFICLVTLLLQPAERLPSLIILDEPELGLHPYAIRLLASMTHTAAAEGVQVILATQQSPWSTNTRCWWWSAPRASRPSASWTKQRWPAGWRTR